MRDASRALVVATVFPFMSARSGTFCTQTAPEPPKPNADLVTREQVIDQKYPNAYNAVEGIHGRWIGQGRTVPRATVGRHMTGKLQYASEQPGGRSRAGEESGTQVYLDGSHVGGVDELESIPAPDLHSIWRIRGTEAEAKKP